MSVILIKPVFFILGFLILKNNIKLDWFKLSFDQKKIELRFKKIKSPNIYFYDMKSYLRESKFLNYHLNNLTCGVHG